MDISEEQFTYRLNDNGTGPGLLLKIFSERGWRLVQGNGREDKWNLWWRTSSFPAACFNSLGDFQFINHIPNGGSICRKDSLSRLLRCMRKIYGTVYDISPPSFHLPLEYAKLVAECSKQRRNSDQQNDQSIVWIHKPVAQSQGRGIFLFRNICEVHCGSAAVVQRYIERPLLIAGYKFDLRLYVCVPVGRPLTAYMYAEGLARFGTDKYTLSDIHNPYRHLTNSSINKSGPRFEECKDRIGSGCKWTLSQIRRVLLSRIGTEEWLVWQRIRALVTLTLLAQTSGIPAQRNCFEFYGFDILLDDCMKPWLLEVNLSPGLVADCDADLTVKGPMLHELFDLLGLPMKNTGLMQLQRNDVLHKHSEEENEVPKDREHIERLNKISSRWRKRKSLHVHCVNIQPLQDQYLVRTLSSHDNDVEKKSKESNIEIEFNDDVSKRSSRNELKPPVWGNGLRWDQAPGQVGQWIRIFPFTTDDKISYDIRESVNQVAKYTKIAKEVIRDCNLDMRNRKVEKHDEYLEDMFRNRLNIGTSYQMWLPSD